MKDYEALDKSQREALAPLYVRLIDGGYISIGPGWNDIVLQLDRDIARLDPDYRIVQVKEKFAQLRYYVDASDAYDHANGWLTDPIYGLIRKAEEASARTCEKCGAPGVQRTDNYWQRTLCDECDTRR
jgi:hypothetical protein